MFVTLPQFFLKLAIKIEEGSWLIKAIRNEKSNKISHKLVKKEKLRTRERERETIKITARKGERICDRKRERRRESCGQCDQIWRNFANLVKL